MRTTGRQRGKAFTLFEALLASAILAMAVTAVMMPFTAGMRSQIVDARQTLATSLAGELMEDILRRPFEEPDDGDEAPESVFAFGPDAGEDTRDDFSAIDDFSGYDEPAGAVLDPSGAVVSDPAAMGLSRHASVAYVFVSGQDPAGEPSFMRVTVEVRYEGEPVVTLTRLVYWVKQQPE